MSNSLLPLVTTIVDLGAGNIATLSTMGDTTHVQTDQGACFHVRQLSMDSVYFEPAQRIIRQSRLLTQLEQEVGQMTSIHRCNVNDHNNQTTPAGRSEMFDYVVESKRRLDNAQKQLSGLQLAINVQNCEDNYINQ
jgi:hypothetical protein